MQTNSETETKKQNLEKLLAMNPQKIEVGTVTNYSVKGGFDALDYQMYWIVVQVVEFLGGIITKSF
ncbi:hypothetical protein JMUB3936_p1048 (plasmid) [Leptotrichia wadei]|uniref:Uncharacterized protein n=1 Tax=Leptotrichia wadei TaxID=157687 RepID=A0A510KWK4_9FUSO|nr:hypothetical protein JMUB3936_p1048 [Leptotrichia wadei]